MLDPQALCHDFLVARQTALRHARWATEAPPLNICRYCGRYWERRAGSHLDGHAACIVSDDFKRQIGELLRSPLVTYTVVADVLGVTPGIVRSWAFSAGVVGPTTHKLRLKNHP